MRFCSIAGCVSLCCWDILTLSENEWKLCWMLVKSIKLFDFMKTLVNAMVIYILSIIEKARTIESVNFPRSYFPSDFIFNSSIIFELHSKEWNGSSSENVLFFLVKRFSALEEKTCACAWHLENWSVIIMVLVIGWSCFYHFSTNFIKTPIAIGNH